MTETNNNNNNSNNSSSSSTAASSSNEYLTAMTALVMDFPACVEPIYDALKCDKSNGMKPGQPSKQCQEQHAHMNFCIMSTFCPEQARVFIDCTKGVIPYGNLLIPNECQKAWKAFDQCLVDRTTEYEKRNHSKPV
ncbi:hypothetical protein SAMD00019534_090620 [Acytostelium subglobosum LB1]|uniref:hypothetical protein n=1 Tax=Acytostelium subglobosum LB1 TaxID=1410327 RepID=UPI000644864A|nr:hypothetical protein SAMD00019534_090620 [Acytostelium subglobosum LB1]GAM25887.1 hypothetical protein SAMD00019534_090620 [Acytostelium subglobosum LB1]|eukprot:XP_012750930.1 hypothetical protein SAMD00019534_090620 [Acytostelium subglobosum LB1]